jgi:hypothetical protein
MAKVFGAQTGCDALLRRMTNQEQQQPQIKLLALFAVGINARNSRRRVPSPCQLNRRKSNSCQFMLLWRRTTGWHGNLHKKPAIPIFRRYGAFFTGMTAVGKSKN